MIAYEGERGMTRRSFHSVVEVGRWVGGCMKRTWRHPIEPKGGQQVGDFGVFPFRDDAHLVKHETGDFFLIPAVVSQHHLRQIDAFLTVNGDAEAGVCNEVR